MARDQSFLSEWLDVASCGLTQRGGHGFGRGLRQVIVLTRKNIVISRRSWGSTTCNLATPFLLLLLYAILRGNQLAQVGIDTDVVRPSSLVPCSRPSGAECATISYGPSNTHTDRIMQILAQQNNLAMGKDITVFSGISNKEIVSRMQASHPADVVIKFYPELTTASNYRFGVFSNNSNIDYIFDLSSSYASPRWTNYDLAGAAHLALVGAIASYDAERTATAKSVSVDAQFAAFPSPPGSSGPVRATNFENRFAPVFLLAGTMWIFNSCLQYMVREKVQKLHQGMTIMGMYHTSYLVSIYLMYMVYGAYTYIVFLLLGFATDLKMVTNADGFAVFLTFFLTVNHMVSLAMFTSSLVTKPVYAGMINFVFIWVFSLILLLLHLIPGQLFDLMWSREPYRGIMEGLSVLPNFNLLKLYTDIAARANDRVFFSEIRPSSGFKWRHVYEHRQVEIPLPGPAPAFDVRIPSPAQTWNLQIGLTFGFLFLAWYLPQVIPNEYTVARKPWFMFDPLYWMPRLGGEAVLSRTKYYTPVPSYVSDDPDLRKEFDLAYGADPEPEGSPIQLRIGGLSKDYRFIPIDALSKPQLALDRVSLTARQNSILAVLGHNGAGKTTMFSTLIGIHSASDGDAVVFGDSIRDNITRVQDKLGICPQYNILWDQLTAREHLELFARLKDVPEAEIEEQVTQRLQDVRLSTVADHFVESFSGGMKRRVSVAISAMGNPQIIFMDEPSSGLDPLNKRHTWDMIERLKTGRVIVLTTHSMAEADALADKIAILADGRLRAVGDSLHLKQRYGTGYSVNVTAEAKHAEAVVQRIKGRLPQAVLSSHSGGNLIFQVPTANAKEMSAFLRFLESDKSLERNLKDWGVSHTTLEDVFLQITGAHGQLHHVAQRQAVDEFSKSASVRKVRSPRGGSRGSRKSGGGSSIGRRSGSRGSRRGGASPPVKE